MTDTPTPVLGSSDVMDPVDYMMHRFEADPRGRSTSVSLQVLDQAPDFDRIVEACDRASRVVRRMRQKVVVPPFGLGDPRWVVDPDFDLGFHVRRVRAPEPGTDRQLLDLTRQVLEDPLDVGRALWQVTVVDDLEGDRSAMILKMSHALTDGLGSMRMYEELFDLERDPAPRAMPPLPIPEDLTPEDIAWRTVTRLPVTVPVAGARAGVRGAGITVRAVRHPFGSARDGRKLLRSAQRVLGPSGATPSPLLQRRGLSSRLETHSVPLAELRSAAKAADCSVNDAYLSALCAVLRRYHDAMGVSVKEMPMATPISLRTDDDPAMGNRFAGAMLRAPIAEEDPAERMRLIREQVIAVRQEPAIHMMGLVSVVLGRVPGPVISGFLGSMTTGNDVQATNIPGFPVPTYIGGAKILESWGFGPLPGTAMMVALHSYSGTCFVSFRYDVASITEFDLFATCIREGFEEVLEIARTSPAAERPKSNPRKRASSPGRERRVTP